MAKRSSSNNRSEVRKFLEDVSVWISGCWHWIGDVNRNAVGYGCFYHKGRRQLAHRYMWELVHDRVIPQGKIIMHTCDNSICVNPEHLRLGTQAENIADMIAKDRRVQGSLLQVTEELITEARCLRRHGVKTPEIAVLLGLGKATVGHMLNTQGSRYSTYFPRLYTSESEQWALEVKDAQ